MSEFNKALVIFFIGMFVFTFGVYAFYQGRANLEQEKANNKTAEACKLIVEQYRVCACKGVSQCPQKK